MKWEQIQAKWYEYKSQVKQRWGALTDDDLAVINGKRDVLAGKIHDRTGVAKDLVERQIADFEIGCVAATPAVGTA